MVIIYTLTPTANCAVISLLMKGQCQQWTRYRSTHVGDGFRHSAPTLLSCQSLCIAQPRCMAIDWDDFEHCYHHDPWTAGHQKRTNYRTDHYQLTRHCGNGSLYIYSWQLTDLNL